MERSYQHLLSELLGLFPCVAVVGVRQSGKTTLVQHLPASWKHFDLEKGSDHELIARDPDLFLRLHSHHVVLDEAQLLPSLFASLRVAIDSDRGTPGRFVITGSSSPELLGAISESLAGRVGVIEMAPFSFAESQGVVQPQLLQLIADSHAVAADFLDLCTAPDALQRQHDFWLRGGYPEPWLRNDRRFSELWMQNYVQTYLNRDIRHLFPGLNHQKFRLFLQILANISGTIINYSDLARTLGVSPPTAREYLQIAHGTFVWRYLPPYEKHAAKRVIKHPKGYLRDTGLHHFLLHLHDLDMLLAHPAFGRSWEALVIEEILRGLNALGIAYDSYYFRTGGGAEVDLVLEGSFGLLPIEIKYGQTVSGRELRGIRDFIKDYGCRYGLVINNDESTKLYDSNLIGIPFAAVLDA